MAAKLKKGDRVQVMTGKDKGATGEILSVDRQRGRAVVSGVNVMLRHTRQTANTQGGRISAEHPVDLSNLMVVDPQEGGVTRVGFKIEDGRKIRFAKKSGAPIDG